MNETSDATAIFAPLWKRKWLILAVAILVAAGTYLYYKRATPVFQVTTQIYLGAGSEEQLPGERGKVPAPSVGNQAAIINSIVVERVRKNLRSEHNLAAAKGKVRVKPGTEKSQFITITVEAHKAKAAALLANAIAHAYIARQRSARQRTILTAIKIARRQLLKLEASSVPQVKPKSSTSKANGSTSKGAVSTSQNFGSVLQIANLNTKINQLEAQLNITAAQQINPAKPGNAQMLSPKPRKNAIFGFVIGLVLAAIAAYVLARFDRRLRSLESVESLFHTRVLTALPKVRRPIVHQDGLSRPSKSLLEPVRRLHTNLQLGSAQRQDGIANHRPASPRLILFISPDPGDGKSTVAADLALVQRDAGERVAVIDANFRRPAQARLLETDGPYGLADALAGKVGVSEALRPVPSVAVASRPAAPHPEGGTATVVESGGPGSLSLLANRGEATNPPALMASEAMQDLLRRLSQDFDYVLIDAPSPLEVSDVMPLLAIVDGILVVARVDHTRESSAQRLAQLLAQTPDATVLGVAANCVGRKDIERYGFSAYNGWRGKLTRR